MIGDIIAIWNHVFDIPNWGELREGAKLVIGGVLIWFFAPRALEEKVAKELALACFVFASTIFLGDTIQLEAFLLYALGKVAWLSGLKDLVVTTIASITIVVLVWITVSYEVTVARVAVEVSAN